jgi:peptidoglycan lytic transglycosylase
VSSKEKFRTGLFRSAARMGGWAMLIGGATLLVAGCSDVGNRFDGSKRQKVTSYSPRVVKNGAPVPRGGGVYKLGRPYKIGGRLYTPRHQPNYSKTGVASWYGKDFHGRLTANGEVYDMHGMSAAHPTLPLPSFARVTNTRTGRSVVVRINDRGPFAHNRIIDLSRRAALELGLVRSGIGKVHVRYLGPAPL